ncbi:MAG: CRISPR-associated endonuclease Cas1 [Candidatus Asgardarchaeia archaeon]
MIVVLDKHGTYVSKEGRAIKIKYKKEKMKPIAVKNLSAIVVLGKVNFSYDALMLLANYGVPVVFSNKLEPKALFHPFFTHGTVITRREQIKAYNDSRGIHLAKKFAIASVYNKISVLKYFCKNRPEVKDGIRDEITFMQGCIHDIERINGSLDRVRMTIMGYEGEASQRYYSSLRYFIPPEIEYNGRNRRPPLDPFNAALSFGYSVLYSKVLIAIAATGLEPYAGFLHADRSGKPSLTLDISEEFKQWVVDRTVLKLFNKGILKPGDFEKKGGGILMGEDGKKKLIGYIGKVFIKKVKVSGYDTKVNPMAVMMNQARKVARYLLGKDKSYEPFLWRV